jgi:hypothetical protein
MGSGAHVDVRHEAEAMRVRALRGYEKAWEAEHTSTPKTVTKS